MCPNCGGKCFHFHGHYEKHHGPNLLTIQRVLCLGCRVTHALIPEQSLPQTSQDTEAVTTYLLFRASGESRRQAGAQVLSMGFTERTLKNLERSFTRCSHNAAALMGFALPPVLNLVAVAELFAIERGPRSLLELNRLALDYHINAVYNSRSSILRFPDRRVRGSIPHNLDSAIGSRLPPNSS